jgi:hypothetical protein
MAIYFKDVKLDSYDKKLSTLDLKEGDKILIVLKDSPEYTLKRSTSKDSSFSDQRHVIVFSVDKPILVNGFAFFRNYDSTPAVYDLSVYEMTEEGAKIPLSVMTNIRVNANEVDSYYVKKVNVPEFEVKPHVKYYCYVHYKLAEMKTYYFSSGSETPENEGVKFKFYEVSELGYKCNKISGHLPYIYYKYLCPLKE